MTTPLPSPLEAAKKILISATAGSCTCNTKSPELIWHAPDCRYALLMMALENVEIAQRGPSEPLTFLRCGTVDAFGRPSAKEPTAAQIDAALNAWFKSPPSESDVGLERSMRAALIAAFAP